MCAILLCMYLDKLLKEQNIHECTLLIKKHPANQPQYNLPTTSQVATTIVTRDIKSIACGRDIKIVSHDGNLIHI